MDNFQEDNIRAPDEVVRETLLEDTRSDFEKQLDEAMYLSIHEMNQQRDINQQYEEQLLKEYADETKRRTNLFTPFYISNADFYDIKKIKKCKINFDGLTFSSSLWLLKK